MNKSDIEFSIGFNTSQAEKQLDNLSMTASNFAKAIKNVLEDSLDDTIPKVKHIYEDIFKDIGQGFHLGATKSYNNFNVPSTQVFANTLTAAENAITKFAQVVETISMRMVNFTLVGNPYTQYQSSTIYNGNRVNGYLSYYPSALQENYGAKPLELPSPNWAINGNDISNAYTKTVNDNPYMGIYERFMQLHNAHAMYEFYKNTFENSQLALPAPKEKEKKVNTDTENTEEIANVTENNSLKRKLLTLGKVYLAYKAIKKVVESIVSLMRRFSDISGNVNSQLIENRGFFTVDPLGAMRANSDYTRAALYEAIKNYGKNSPISKAGLDVGASKLTDMWTKAVTGQSVDAKTSTAVEMLKREFGIDISAEALLTGKRQGKTATDLQLEYMNALEENLQSLAGKDPIKQGQLIEYFRTILGDEMVNAIVSHSNLMLKSPKNKRVTLASELLSHGDSAMLYEHANVSSDAHNVTESLAELNEALSTLKKTAIDKLSPAFIELVTATTNVINWFDKLWNRGKKEESNEAGHTATTTTNRWNYFWDQSYYALGTDKESKRKLKAVKQPKSFNDVINSINAQGIWNTEGAVEALHSGIQQQLLVYALHNYAEDFSPLENSDNPFIRRLAKYGNVKGFMDALEEAGLDTSVYGGYSGLTSGELYYISALWSNSQFKNMFKDLYLKGGEFDFNGDNPFDYLYNPSNFSSAESMGEWAKMLVDNMNKGRRGDANYEFAYSYNDTNNNGKVDFGEVTLQVNFKDQEGRVFSTQNINGTFQKSAFQ